MTFEQHKVHCLVSENKKTPLLLKSSSHPLKCKNIYIVVYVEILNTHYGEKFILSSNDTVAANMYHI